jgi:hypothetical protein
MSAKIYFFYRREPPDAVMVTLRDKECGLREVILPGNELHGLYIKPMGERAHSSRVAGEDIG